MRRPAGGECSVQQLAEDVAALAEARVDHVFLTATMAIREVGELLERPAGL